MVLQGTGTYEIYGTNDDIHPVVEDGNGHHTDIFQQFFENPVRGKALGVSLNSVCCSIYSNSVPGKGAYKRTPEIN